MDKERTREVRRSGGGAAARSPPAKRQPRAIAGHIAHHPIAIDSVSDEANGEMGSDGTGGWSEGEEALHAAPTTATTSLSIRKRVKINGKVSEGYGAVNPVMVPRRLRSAINKRSSVSASPLPTNAKRNPRGSSSNGLRRQKQNMFNNLITKDEVEVAETLSTLASVVFVKNSEDKEDGRMSIDNSETDVPAFSSEASKKEATGLLHSCSSFEATNLSSYVEESGKETAKAVPSVKEQLSTTPASQRTVQESNKTAQTDIERTLLIRKEEVENTSSNDAGKSSKPLGSLSEVYVRNRLLQPTQVDTLPDGEPNLGWPPFGSPAAEHEEHPVKQKSNNCVQYVSRGETADFRRPGLPSYDNGHLTMSYSSKTASRPGTVSCAARPDLTKNGLKTEKLQPISADRRRSWARCVTHVSICHLIQNHQNIEKKRQLSLPPNQLKVKEGTDFAVQTANEIVEPRNGMHSITSGASGFVMDRNLREANLRMLQDGRLLQAHQATIPSGTFAKQKQFQGSTFHGLSTTCGTKIPGIGVNSHEQLSIPYMQSQMQRHPAVMPFPFPHGPYPSAYTEQLAASATQQLQMPHYLGNPFYGAHVGGAAKQQQQQMWPAHLTHLRPQMGMLKWHNGRLPDPTLIPCAQPSCTVPAPPCHQQHHQLLPLPPPSSSSRPNQQHIHQDASGGLRPEVPTKLQQLLCNTQNR